MERMDLVVPAHSNLSLREAVLARAAARPAEDIEHVPVLIDSRHSYCALPLISKNTP